MVATDCVPGSVTYFRAFVSSGKPMLHPCVFNLFPSHLFSSQPHQMHMNTHLLHHCQLPPAPSLTDAPGAAGSDLPFASPLPLPSQTRFYYVVSQLFCFFHLQSQWQTSQFQFQPPFSIQKQNRSSYSYLYCQLRLNHDTLLIGLQKQPLGFNKKWLRVVAREFYRSGNLALFCFV